MIINCFLYFLITFNNIVNNIKNNSISNILILLYIIIKSLLFFVIPIIFSFIKILKGFYLFYSKKKKEIISIENYNLFKLDDIFRRQC